MAEAGGEGVGGDVGSRPLATSSMARSETKKNASKDAGQSGSLSSSLDGFDFANGVKLALRQSEGHVASEI